MKGKDKERKSVDVPIEEIFKEGETWLTVSQAAAYGKMKPQNIYNAIKVGNPIKGKLAHRKNKVTKQIEIEKNTLELWFCPFKQSANHDKNMDMAESVTELQLRIESLRKRNKILEGNVEDLRKTVERLEGELDEAHARECKILKLISFFENHLKK